jgi:tetraacyldisaccharide 4'-kinase
MLNIIMLYKNKPYLINYLLLPFSAIFYIFSAIRKLLYKTQVLSTYNVNVPLIVVGNITLGGSGKTPIVIALSNYFTKQGKKVGVLSRGYGGKHNQGNLLVDDNTDVNLSGDEPLLIAIQTNAIVVVNKKRVLAAEYLVNEHKVDLIISDDGLQHYAMNRDIEIALINSKQGLGNGFLFPAGYLREPKSRLNSVDFIINTYSLKNQENNCKMLPSKFINVVTGEEKNINFFKNKKCHAIAGICFPQNFFDLLLTLEINFKQHSFSDHYSYSEKDLNFADNNPIIMTAKDYVKCRKFANNKMWYLQIVTKLDGNFLTKLSAKL